MNDAADFPGLMLATVLTSGGPFSEGEVISIAFMTPRVGRIVRHEATRTTSEIQRTGDALVPDAISARVTVDADPFLRGDVVVLSFVDARFAGIHRIEENHRRAGGIADDTEVSPVVREQPLLADSERIAADGAGVRVRLEWNAERARRFVQVVDRLFTVDRLGWYRHVLAIRLLVPDVITCSNDVATREADVHLRAVRAATIEALGRPLLAAYMPGFGVSQDWLDTIESPAIVRELASLRDTIFPFADDATVLPDNELERGSSLGVVPRSDLDRAVSTSVDALLAALIPHQSADAELACGLRAYRSSLVEAFSQTAHSSGEVRLGRMSEPNHALDDRLWRLVGIVGMSFDGLAVA